jgi:hypothetical protein
MGYSTALIGIQAIRNAGANPDRAKVRAGLARSSKVPVVIGDGLWTLDAGRGPAAELRRGDPAGEEQHLRLGTVAVVPCRRTLASRGKAAPIWPLF